MFKNWFLYVPLKTHGPTVSLTLFLTCRVLARLDRISPVSIPSKTVRRNATPTGDLAQWQLQSLVVRSSEQQRVVPGEADAPHRSAVHLAGFRRFRSFRRPTGPFLDRKQHVPSRSRQRLTKPSTIERFRIPGAAARVRWNSTGPTWANSTDHRSLPLPLPLLSLSLCGKVFDTAFWGGSRCWRRWRESISHRDDHPRSKTRSKTPTQRRRGPFHPKHQSFLSKPKTLGSLRIQRPQK